jgi:arylformamidase
MNENYKIIDISQPISKATACFPGDTPFDYTLKASFSNDGYNLTTFTMSPHIGTHTDAPSHVIDNMGIENSAGSLPLTAFIGQCRVIDLSPCRSEITIKHIEEKLRDKTIPPRILLRTRAKSHFNIFEQQSAYLSVEAIEYLNHLGVKLIGVDTASVDAVDSKTLDAHHALIAHNMVWIENLDLSAVKEDLYFLSALPLKFMELEAAPVRAVLLSMEGMPC